MPIRTIQFATAFLTAFPDDLQVTIDDLFAAGDKVTARWTAQGTHNGPLRGIPTSGNQVTWLGMAIYSLPEGKITLPAPGAAPGAMTYDLVRLRHKVRGRVTPRPAGGYGP